MPQGYQDMCSQQLEGVPASYSSWTLWRLHPNFRQNQVKKVGIFFEIQIDQWCLQPAFQQKSIIKPHVNEVISNQNFNTKNCLLCYL